MDIDQTCQVNYKTVGQETDQMDEFHAAIGIATLKLAVSGRVETSKSSRRMIEVDKLGVYLRDSYDFEDDWWLSQPLGVWWPPDGVAPIAYPGQIVAPIALKPEPVPPTLN